MPSSLNWRGDEVKAEVRVRLAQMLTEFGLTVEGEAKKELQKGHGVLTGTLRRSIHTADPGYDWGGDDVEPGIGAPERGGSPAQPSQEGSKMTIQVGSGMKYALPVHQGHGSFTGYHFLTNGLEKAKNTLGSILAKYRFER